MLGVRTSHMLPSLVVAQDFPLVFLLVQYIHEDISHRNFVVCLKEKRTRKYKLHYKEEAVDFLVLTSLHVHRVLGASFSFN